MKYVTNVIDKYLTASMWSSSIEDGKLKHYQPRGTIYKYPEQVVNPYNRTVKKHVVKKRT